MRQFAGMRALDVWYARIEVDELMAQLRGQMKKRMAKKAEKTVAKARTKDSMTAFSKLTRMVDGEPQIVSDPPLIERITDLASGREADRHHATSCTSSCGDTERRCRPTGASCWRSIDWSTSPARSSASAASAPAPGSR